MQKCIRKNPPKKLLSTTTKSSQNTIVNNYFKQEEIFSHTIKSKKNRIKIKQQSDKGTLENRIHMATMSLNEKRDRNFFNPVSQ